MLHPSTIYSTIYSNNNVGASNKMEAPIAPLEYPDNEINELHAGVFQELHCFNRCVDGVIKHAATMEDYFGADAHVKYIEIVDAVTGRTTDEFYGAHNDFNMTALAKAAKGEKFFVYGFDGDRCTVLFTFIWLRIGTGESEARVTIRCNRNGQWRVTSWLNHGDPYDETISPHYNDQHKYLFIDHESGEILEEFVYQYTHWAGVINVFEKYVQSERKFDLYLDGEPVKRMLRLFQQAKSGKWVRKDY